MKEPPHPDIENICFNAVDAESLVQIMDLQDDSNEYAEIMELANRKLPPIASYDALAAMFGYNPTFIQTISKKPRKHYNTFSIHAKGKIRSIEAPKVGLKLIQRWLNYHWNEIWKAPDNVFGFVKGRSHILAARQHLGAKWVVSCDIEDFFPSVSSDKVRQALQRLGYTNDRHLDFCIRLVCYKEAYTKKDRLTQGAPTSPLLSNIVLEKLDGQLAEMSTRYGCIFTRYADDIVFSGKGERIPDGLANELKKLVVEDGWVISERKFEELTIPRRLKVHGLLVHGDKLRLTKGYRNRIRLYKHLKAKGINLKNADKIDGHINYANSVDAANIIVP